tara:strand:- start:56 stop:895 length:840 start_codon:yes stop_codon:yes gene_type:complete
MPDLFVNKLTVIDFSYLDPNRGLVGESWQVNVILQGILDDQGMILDFGHVKKMIKKYIDENYDHKLIVPIADKIDINRDENNNLIINYSLSDGNSITHISPSSAVMKIEGKSVSAKICEKAISHGVFPEMPENITNLIIELVPEKTEDHYYHYSHGLKNHNGNCQRIAHGHRSKIVIKRNEKRESELEAVWARKFRDIYIGTHEDLIYEKDGKMAFQYYSSMGKFFLELPSDKCYLIKKESTVENIAQHIVNELKKENPIDFFQVYAFEGIDKGAISQK